MTSRVVRFFKSGDVAVDDWNSARLFWLDGIIQGESEEYFDVELGTLAMRATWLRDFWVDSGYSVIVEPAVSEAVAALRANETYFLNLMRMDEIPSTIDFSILGLKRELTPEQRQNLECLNRMSNGANFSVPGAGKTSTTLVMWKLLCNSEAADSMLVVCPKSAFEAWESEPDLLFETPPCVHLFSDDSIPNQTEILIVNYEGLDNPDRLKRIKRWVSARKTMLVVDEAHRVKAGPRSVRWRACKQLSEVAVRTDLLTGTPMPQGYEDLINLFSLNWPLLTRRTLNESNLTGLSRGGVFVRTTKSELGLPPPTIIPHIVNMGEVQSAIYGALRKMYVGTFKLSSRDNDVMAQKGRAVMSLLGAASNPGLLTGSLSEDSFLNLHWPPRAIENDAELMNLVRSYAEIEIPAKYDWIRRYVASASAEGRKVLIWSNFIGNLRALHRLLAPHNPALVFGGVSGADRREEIGRFRDSPDCHVLLSNPQTLGEGISLHHVCHDAIYLDRSYNAGLYLQSLDRIHRLGLAANTETRIHVLMANGTIDQRVDKRLVTKVDRLGRALDDPHLSEVSLPDSDVDFDAREFLGLDDFDEHDLYGHLIGSDESS